VNPLRRSELFRYGLFGVPLAFAGLPIYVHLPQYYSAVHGMSLSLIGALLLAARLIDTVQDPLIGWAGDRWPQHRRRAMLFCIPLLALSYAALFYPVILAGTALSVWFIAALIAVYSGFSLLSIFYNGLGVGLAGGDYHENTRVTSVREGMVLLGIILAAALPHMLIQRFGMAEGFRWVSVLFALMLFSCAWPLMSMRRVFALPVSMGAATSCLSGFMAPVRACIAEPDLRWLFALFFVNALPVAVTSTLFLFFVEDRLRTPDATGWLLALYFLAAALSVPVWAWLTKRYGKRSPLMWALLLAVASFVWAYGLRAGEISSFAMICILSGIAVGGDLAILPSLLADALKARPHMHSFAFGIWNFLSKLTLALAAGIALPLLDIAGYHPGMTNSEDALTALAVMYAVLPCALKLLSITLLSLSPLDQRRHA
jgi:Na+/melibiose symporter-like transporter